METEDKKSRQSAEVVKCYAQSIPFLYINRRTILGHDDYPYVQLPWSLPGIGAVPMGALLRAWNEDPDNFSISDESGTSFWIYSCYENADGSWMGLWQSMAGEDVEHKVGNIREIIGVISRLMPEYSRQKESMLQNADFEHCMALLKSELGVYYLNDEEFDRLRRLLPNIREFPSTDNWISFKTLHFYEYIRMLVDRHQEFSISPDLFRIFLTQSFFTNCTVIRFAKDRHLFLISDRWIGIGVLPLEVTAAQEEFMLQVGRLVMPEIIKWCKDNLHNIPIFRLPKEKWVISCGSWFDQSIWRFLDPVTAWPAAINDLVSRYDNGVRSQSEKGVEDEDEYDYEDEDLDYELPIDLPENDKDASYKSISSLSQEEIDLRIDRIMDMFGMNDDPDK